MKRLPFNPVSLLALFMPKQNAGSLAGDLEERFQKVCRRHGCISAVFWFWWALLISMPSIVIAAARYNPHSPRITLGHPLRIGTEVSIIEGPLAGLKGTVIEMDDRRGNVVLSVFFLQRFVPVGTKQTSVLTGTRWHIPSSYRMSLQRLRHALIHLCRYGPSGGAGAPHAAARPSDSPSSRRRRR
jgi:hypothetical protein